MSTEIKGYRYLNGNEVARINEAKALEEQVIQFINNEMRHADSGKCVDGQADPRWLAIAKTDIEKGFMALTRAIARPEG